MGDKLKVRYGFVNMVYSVYNLHRRKNNGKEIEKKKKQKFIHKGMHSVDHTSFGTSANGVSLRFLVNVANSICEILCEILCEIICVDSPHLHKSKVK